MNPGGESCPIRPEATAPIDTPSRIGVMTLALEKIRPQRRWAASCWLS